MKTGPAVVQSSSRTFLLRMGKTELSFHHRDQAHTLPKLHTSPPQHIIHHPTRRKNRHLRPNRQASDPFSPVNKILPQVPSLQNQSNPPSSTQRQIHSPLPPPTPHPPNLWHRHH